MSRYGLCSQWLNLAEIMAEGNSGAMGVLRNILDYNAIIDPDSGHAPAIKTLFDHKIYGLSIWVLYSELADHDLIKALTILKACSIGFIDIDDLKNACNRKDLDWEKKFTVIDLYYKVKSRIPNFDLNCDYGKRLYD